MQSALLRCARAAVAWFALALTLGAAAMAQAQAADERLALATELAELTLPEADEAVLGAMMDNMWSLLRQAMPTGDANILDELYRYAQEFLTPIMMDMLTAVRAESVPQFSASLAEALPLEDLRMGVAFYGSTAGRRLSEIGPEVNAFTLATVMDQGGTTDAAHASLNPVLRAYGMEELPLSGAGALADPPVLSAVAITARGLVYYTPDMLDPISDGVAADFVERFWADYEATLPANPILRQDLRAALDAGMRAFHRARIASLIDRIAVFYTTRLSPEEITVAATFITSPETQSFRYNLEIAALEHNARSSALLRQRQAAMLAQLAGMAAGFNAILTRHGLPPVPF